MSIQFIRQYPNGRRAWAEFTTGRTVEDQARKFIASGGAYVCEITADGNARLAACIQVDGKQQDVATEVCANGPALRDAVDRLIICSIPHIKESA